MYLQNYGTISQFLFLLAQGDAALHEHVVHSPHRYAPRVGGGVAPRDMPVQ
jgi:hypothetical protein